MYTNAELLQATGITGRQLRTYRSRRLIDPPYPRTSRNERGEYPIWGEKHIKQIRDIQEIRHNNKTLDQIRELVHKET